MHCLTYVGEYLKNLGNHFAPQTNLAISQDLHKLGQLWEQLANILATISESVTHDDGGCLENNEPSLAGGMIGEHLSNKTFNAVFETRSTS